MMAYINDPRLEGLSGMARIRRAKELGISFAQSNPQTSEERTRADSYRQALEDARRRGAEQAGLIPTVGRDGKRRGYRTGVEVAPAAMTNTAQALAIQSQTGNSLSSPANPTGSQSFFNEGKGRNPDPVGVNGQPSTIAGLSTQLNDPSVKKNADKFILDNVAAVNKQFGYGGAAGISNEPAEVGPGGILNRQTKVTNAALKIGSSYARSGRGGTSGFKRSSSPRNFSKALSV